MNTYTFEQLKAEFKQYDTCPQDENSIVIGKLFLRRNGDISIHPVAFELDGSCVTVSCSIARKRTPEQMKSFLNGVL